MITIDILMRVLQAAQAQGAFSKTAAAASSMSGSISQSSKRAAGAFEGPINNAKLLAGALAGVANNSRSIDVAERAARRLNSSLDASAERFENLNRVSQRFTFAGMALTGVGLGMAFIGSKALGAAGDMQQVRIGLETMLGSAEAATDMIKQLQAFDVVSPFDFAESAAGAQKLLAMGTAAKDVIPTMTAIGDAVSAAGGGQDAFNGILLALGQIQTKGKVSSEELNQMAERGIPALRILERELKLTKDQVANIGQEGIEASVAIPALLKGFETDFPGAMAKSAETLQGKLSTLDGSVNRLGASLSQYWVPAVTVAIGATTGLTDALNAMPVAAQVAISGIYGISTMALTAGGSILTIGANIAQIAPVWSVFTAFAASKWAALGAFMTSTWPGITSVITAGWATMTTAAATYGAAAWAALAPMLPLIIAIGAAFAAVIGVMTWYQNKKAKQSEDESKAMDRQYYDNEQASRAKKGMAPLEDYDTWWKKNRASDYENDDSGAADTSKLDASMAELKKMQAAGGPTFTVPTPSASTLPSAAMGASPWPAAPTIPVTNSSTPPAISGGAPGLPAYGPPAISPAALTASLDAQIRALDDQIYAEKDKKEKARLQGQMRDLRRARQDAAKAQQAANKAAKEADAAAKTTAGADASIAAELTRSRVDSMNDTRRRAREDAKDALDAEVDKIRDGMKAKTITREAGDNKIQALQEAFDKRQNALDLMNDAEVKRIQAQSELIEAAAKAATEAGARRDATMKVANARAASLRLDADASEKRARTQSERASVAEREAANPAGGAVDFATQFRNFLAKRQGGTVQGFGASAGAGSTGGGGPVRVGNPTYGTNSSGARIIQFPPIVLPQEPFARQVW